MDEHNGRDSEAPSSSSSDFYNLDAQATQPSMPAPAALLPQEQDNGSLNTTHDHDDADDEDSSSEMDVSASSRASSAEPDHPPSQRAGFKRNFSDNLNGPKSAAEQESAKRLRLSILPVQHMSGKSRGVASLPVELWQQVFLHLPPAMLSRCLRVSRDFNKYLTTTKAAPAAKKGLPKVRVLDSEAIWTNARKIFFPNLPRPLGRCSELEMLQLVGGRTCQFCTREPIPSPATTPFNCGPGPDGLRVIWPFGIRACGRCLENNTVKASCHPQYLIPTAVNSIQDIVVLVQLVSALRLGMPYAFLTPDLNFIPEIQRQAPGGIPSHLRAAKVYYGGDIEAINSEHDVAKALGEGAADEWRKGLQTKGKEAMADAARWEKWEAQMRLGSDLSQVLREYDSSSFSRHVEEAQSSSVGVNGSQQAYMPNGAHTLPHPVQTLPGGYGISFQFSPSQFQHAPKSVRDPTEVEIIRQARRIDIERRCMELEPPLEPNVLSYIPAFNATLMISRQMTDAEWETLRPRILAQRYEAENLEHQKQEQWAALNSTIMASAAEETYIKPAKELYDKEYEHSQEPLRKKLGEYAVEYIRDSWNDGQNLDKDTCPTFAVETMLHVRGKYLQVKAAGALPSYEPPVKTGSKQGTPTPEPFLSLDNMKWVYDNMIKPLAENERRELFICAGCAEERRPKWFAFEGLIQHYGAKHTTAFSKGNIIVHWQTSDWPIDPPFHRHPAQFIQADRRVSDYKTHGRMRNTPQVSHDGPFAPPASGKLLSENPFFAPHHAQSSHQLPNGHHNNAAGYSAYQNGHGSPYTSAHYRYPSAAASEPQMDVSEHARVHKLSSDAGEIWEGLEGVAEMLECVRVKAVFHHVITRFSEQFRQKPSLDLVTDALATNELIRPVKNAQGLACKFCVASQTDGSANNPSYFARIRNVKLFNISSLITHFKIAHQAHSSGQLDWTEDMIELPETQIVSGLIRTPGMDDHKLAIVDAAFPYAFPHPLPKIGLVQEPPQDLGPDSGLASRLLDRLNKKPKRQPRRSAGNGTGTPGREGSHEPLPEANEDEYDPRRPMYVLPEGQGADPSRFDTDIARKASTAPSTATSHTLNLAPETLAALNNLSVLTSQSQQPQVDDRGDRSPSVGRDESLSSLGRPADSTPKAAPDISAILASLTGQVQPAHVATSSTAISNRSDSGPKYPPHDPYGLPHSPSTYQEQRRPPGRYVSQPSYSRVSTEHVSRLESQDVYATTSRNVENFEQNRAQAYDEPTYQPPAQSPPRYRYVHGDGQQYAHPPLQQTPAYHEQPVQYLQLSPAHNRPQVQVYQYERPTSKPMYVDEYGRHVELVPIDSAPAPVQYLPHPYEQQQQQRQQLQPQQQHYARVLEQTPAAHPHVAQPVYYDHAGSPLAGRGGQGMY